MMKICQTLVLFVVIAFVESREINGIANRSDDQNDTTKLAESRKHKPYHDLFLSDRKSGFSTVYVNPLRVMGGLQSLVTFIVIKIKLVLVIATVVGFVVLALKLFGFLKYASYPYKNYYPSIGPPPHEFSSYPGPPLTSYSSSHHDHDAHSQDWSSYDDHYAARSSGISPARLNMKEMMHSFVNADKEDCRAHLLCEFQNIVSKSSFFRHLTRQTARRDSSDRKEHDENCAGYVERCLRWSTSSFQRRKRREMATLNGLLNNC